MLEVEDGLKHHSTQKAYEVLKALRLVNTPKQGNIQDERVRMFIDLLEDNFWVGGGKVARISMSLPEYAPDEDLSPTIYNLSIELG